MNSILVAMLASVNGGFAADVAARDPVVHAIDDTATRAAKGLRTLCNQRDVDPSARITAITASDVVRVAKLQLAGSGHIKS